MALDTSVLRNSFEIVIDRQPMLVQRFYDILFHRYPQARNLFGRRSQAAQEKMLTDALLAVLDHLEDTTWLATTLKPLGAKHVGYGVTDEMYDWVGSSLLMALAEAAGPHWTVEDQAAWTEAYGAIAGLMKAGAAAVIAAPASDAA